MKFTTFQMAALALGVVAAALTGATAIVEAPKWVDEEEMVDAPWVTVSERSEGAAVLPTPSFVNEDGSVKQVSEERLQEMLDAQKIDVNTADEKTLTKLNGIGPSTAKAIIAYRNAHGPFKTLDALDDVPRIGRKTIDKFRQNAKVGDLNAAAAAIAAATPVSSSASRQRSTAGLASSGNDTVTYGSPADRIDINTASQKELETLPRIGPVTAGNIIAYRDSHGPFKTVDDLVKVPRIGPATLAGLVDMVTVQAGGGAASPKAAPGPSAGAMEPAAAPSPRISGGGCQPGQININTANSAQLQKLHRVGPATAEKIITYRTEHGGFKRIDDITKVKGIGPKTLEGFRDNICVD